jgi:hypothetical protein
MNARLRLSFPKGRLVFPLPQEKNFQRWCALHRDEPDWSAIFGALFWAGFLSNARTTRPGSPNLCSSTMVPVKLLGIVAGAVQQYACGSWSFPKENETLWLRRC